jgi:hypothetical protein
MINYKDILIEAKEFPVQVIKKVQQMTDHNDHAGARILVAKNINNKKMLAAYEGLDAMNAYFGHSPQELLSLRNKLDKELFVYLKKAFTNGQDIYMAM